MTSVSKDNASVDNIPAHLSENVFRRWEDLLGMCAKSPTGEVVINDGDTNLSITTIAARLRDANKSLQLYQWESVHWPRSNPPVFQVLLRGETVRLINPAVYRRPAATPTGAIQTSGQIVDATDPDVLRSIVVLLHHRVLFGPIRVHCRLDRFDLTNFDVNIEKIGDNEFILV